MQALRTAATGMAAQQLNVEVISNNIANMNTVGFKRQRAEFQDLLYQTLVRAGAQSSSSGTVVPTGVQIGAGVRAGSVYRITSQGSMTRTDNPYDLAINGRGWGGMDDEQRRALRMWVEHGRAIEEERFQHAFVHHCDALSLHALIVVEVVPHQLDVAYLLQ